MLNRIGEAQLMAVLVSTDEKERIQGFESFVKTIEEEGVPSPFFEENIAIPIVQAVSDEDSPERTFEYWSNTFAQLIAQAVTTPAANAQEAQNQASWLPRIVQAMKGSSFQQSLLDTMLFEMASRSGRDDVLAIAMDLQANPEILRASRTPGMKELLTPFGEAVANGRMGKAIALMPFTSQETVSKTLASFEKGHLADLNGPCSLQCEAFNAARALSKPEGFLVFDFLKAVEKKMGESSTQEARASILKAYLGNCRAQGNPWDDVSFAELDIPSGGSSSSLQACFQSFWEKKNGPDDKAVDSWMAFAKEALDVGCYPALKIVAPLIAQQTSNGVCRGLALEKCLKYQGPRDPYVPERFKACMEVLMAQGVDINKSSQSDPLVFHLAQARDHKFSKLEILVGLGMNARVKKRSDDGIDITAADCVEKPEEKKQWENLLLSMQARKTLFSLLDEMGPAGCSNDARP